MTHDMPPDEFRRFGYETIDWIADFLANTRAYRVLPDIQPGALTDALPPAGPERGEPMEALLRDFRDQIVPATTIWNHPRFFAYFSISASGPGILGELLTAALDVNGMLWKSSPAATELEQVALGWLRQWLGLPDDFFGLIYDTASVSSMHAIAAARELLFPEVRENGGLSGAVMYCSEHAHSSIDKGAIALGVGHKNVRKVPVDSDFRMMPGALEQMIGEDRAAGRKPFCVVATTGTTSTTSVDPVARIADIAQRQGLWLHVDAAYGGSAAVVPEMQPLFAGWERADSIVMNPHKWLFTPTDISVFYTRRPDVLRRAFSLVPEYLKTTEDPRAVNLMDYGVQLGRRFRALKLWFVLRYFGHEGIAAILRDHIAMAQEFAGWVRSDERFEVVAPVPFSLVCFRKRGPDDPNRVILEAVNATGQAFLSHTVLNGKFALRLAIGNIRTTRDDLRVTWDLLRKFAEEGLLSS
jgi:aromatic-L-amino-acid/L-tryptophan decarboxylase